jgi:hypothetical protein
MKSSALRDAKKALKAILESYDLDSEQAQCQVRVIQFIIKQGEK